MLQVLRMGIAVLGVAAFAVCGVGPAEAGCQLVTATHSAGSKAEAASTSRALALQSAYDLKAARRWTHITMSARKVKGGFIDPNLPGSTSPAGSTNRFSS